jgi:hypothetical protein
MILPADIGLGEDGGTVRLLVGGAVLENGHTLSDYPMLLTSDCPTVHILTVSPPVPSPAPVPSTTTAQITSDAVRQIRLRRLVADDDAEGSTRHRQRQQAEQCEADRLLAIAIAQAEEEENAAAAVALQERYEEELGADGSSRFSDDDDSDIDEIATSDANGDDRSPEPAPEQGDEVAALEEEISTAQAQTAWSGKKTTSSKICCAPAFLPHARLFYTRGITVHHADSSLICVTVYPL